MRSSRRGARVRGRFIGLGREQLAAKFVRSERDACWIDPRVDERRQADASEETGGRESVRVAEKEGARASAAAGKPRERKTVQRKRTSNLTPALSSSHCRAYASPDTNPNGETKYEDVRAEGGRRRTGLGARRTAKQELLSRDTGTILGIHRQRGMPKMRPRDGLRWKEIERG